MNIDTNRKDMYFLFIISPISNFIFIINNETYLDLYLIYNSTIYLYFF
jgi:hypothetical protein